ncbi:hypothetical protein [Noviherbaspirillum pedocola]|uniref:Uncharacterized protein n=1 Tax=Noviherbaspirillum pedocola TaxID=2801341 RepID=A0A934SZC9_9BURK|nr:hypothetical protein [Noviherbaspirillum pedocola]MBK4735479.1 hypothetical protein [Noviherbaspirillum pedocola]
MSPNALTDDLRRLIFAIPSIPHLEALLLMRREPQDWEAPRLAQRLYLPTERAAHILADLLAAQLCSPVEDAAGAYRYAPAPETEALVESLQRYYSSHLIEVTNMIHTNSRPHSRIREFADAFKWRKRKP